MAMRRVISPATAGTVDMRAQTVTLPLSVYLGLCSQHGRDDEMDDFLMYTYKVRRCPRTRAHDWTECPYAHRAEKARRRDPRKFPYQGIVCPDFKNGECSKGQNCEYAHGIFEFWLHPTRFRTKVCESGVLCPRKVCFFAHTPEQLRPEGVHHCSRCEQRGRTSDSAAGGAIGNQRRDEAAATTTETTRGVAVAVAVAVAPPSIGGAGGSTVRFRCEVDEAYNDFEHLQWVVDLVNW